MGIALSNIHKSFGKFKALQDINLQFNEGELTALLGPSGSGKTSLLRLVAGLDQPDNIPGIDSQILIQGKDMSNDPVGKRNIGFVFQHYALFRHLTVFENVAFGLRVKPKKIRPTEGEIENTVYSLLDLVQLTAMAHRKPSQLSGGQRQRVALARALAIKPKVLLLDEPFGSLDAKVRMELRIWLRKLQEQMHFTSIFVTHDQEEALEVADRIVIMNGGQVEQVGTPEQVFNDPASEFVMQFLGEVNIFHGRGETESALFGPEISKNRRILIRPHDFQIFLNWEDYKPPDPTRAHLLTVIAQRVHKAGAMVKIHLIDKNERTILVQMSHNEYENMPISPGQTIFLKPKNRIFSTEDKVTEQK